MNGGIFVSGEPDVTNLARLFGSHHSFVCSTGTEVPVWICHPDIFVELNEVDVIGLQTPQRFIDLLSGGRAGAPVVFGHQEGPAAIAVLKRLSHADLAVTIMVIP